MAHGDRLSWSSRATRDAPVGRSKSWRENNILTVIRETLSDDLSAALTGDFQTVQSDFLKPSAFIQSDHRTIRRLAKKIIGNQSPPLEKVRKLVEWVHRNIEKRPVISLPDALTILENRVGDCNEHATLLTALLRAVGIPARISVGLVYIREGFYYHAWVEAYTGQWITLDPTLHQMPADVTHISLLRGNIDKQVEIMALIGKIKLEVVDFEYY